MNTWNFYQPFLISLVFWQFQILTQCSLHTVLSFKLRDDTFYIAVYMSIIAKSYKFLIYSLLRYLACVCSQNSSICSLTWLFVLELQTGVVPLFREGTGGRDRQGALNDYQAGTGCTQDLEGPDPLRVRTCV